MVEQLFGSKTRVKLLQLFYGNPNRSYYVREITRKIDEQINSVRRELANLLSIGIISSETNNNRLYYEVNQKFEYFDPLSAIFGGQVFKSKKLAVEKTESNSAVTANDDEYAISAVGNVDLALLTGQFTRDEKSGIDLLVVGDVNQTKINHFVADLEAKEGKEIRFTVLSMSEFNYRRQVNDRFISNVLEAKMQILLDRSHILSAKPNLKKSKSGE